MTHTPAVLRRAAAYGAPPRPGEEVEESAALPERIAADCGDSHHSASHPTRRLCHACLISPG
ncbi:hypothetical protein [Streptomyces sp. V2I9]|uniref:hypothetical protein n=1 Tax=Streptomyces sp. V2I9 TaxID=3042304 RepID=UPI00278AD82C|nr:hypothetical protein [Streptomyces sp. V2I9]MDQ0987661.1 hypothetical protein [Streptomyces sp. V2I9]